MDSGANRSIDTDRFNGYINACAIRTAEDFSKKLVARGMQCFRCADFFGKFQARSVHIRDVHGRTTRGAECLQAEETYHSSAKYEGFIAGGNSGEGNCVRRNGNSLQHGRFRKRERIRQTINNSLRNDDILGESSSAAIVRAGNAQDLSAVAEIDFSAGAIRTSTARNCGIKRNAIAFGPAAYLQADGSDSPGSFVAHHDGRNAPAGSAVIAVHVAATNTAGRHFDQEFARSWSWRGKIGNFKMPIFGKKHRFHRNVGSAPFSAQFHARDYAPLMPERREIVKFAGSGRIPALIIFTCSFVKSRRFLEPLPLLAVVTEDDQLNLFALYEIE